MLHKENISSDESDLNYLLNTDNALITPRVVTIHTRSFAYYSVQENNFTRSLWLQFRVHVTAFGQNVLSFPLGKTWMLWFNRRMN